MRHHTGVHGREAPEGMLASELHSRDGMADILRKDASYIWTMENMDVCHVQLSIFFRQESHRAALRELVPNFAAA